MAPEFSTIIQAPEVRALVQEGLLERAFHDSLYPNLLFRAAADPHEWEANVGDSMFFTAPGLIPVAQKPIRPGEDPIPATYESEQWEATLQQYANTIDTHMPTSITAIANLFLRNGQQLGLNAGQTLNRVVRNKLFNASLAGSTVANGAQTTTTLAVQRLNGFTTARSATGVRFNTVSGNNPLTIQVFESGTPATRTVIGFTPTTPGDEIGPGTLTLNASVTVIDRDPVIAGDATAVIRVGGGDAVDAIGGTDLFNFASIRSAVARFRDSNVPAMPDGRFHCHLDPTSEAQIFSDNEFQRLNQSLPDFYMYKQFAIGEILGTIFYRNNENPQVTTVTGGATATFDENDPFAGELFSDGVAATGTRIHRALFTGQGAINEYHQPLDQLITEAGINGKVGEAQITNNGIRVMTERIQLIFRAPQNRLQDQVSTSWKFIGDWPVRTDATTGDDARFKRVVCVEHGE